MSNRFDIIEMWVNDSKLEFSYDKTTSTLQYRGFLVDVNIVVGKYLSGNMNFYGCLEELKHIIDQYHIIT